jgi:hypothetical protein
MPVDPDTTTVRLIHPPEYEGGPSLQLVTLWLPADYLAQVEAIRAETAEDVAGVVLRHSKGNVASEARRFRVANQAAALHGGRQ